MNDEGNQVSPKGCADNENIREPQQTSDEAAERTQAAAAPTGAVMLSYAEYEELKTLAKERDEFLKRLQRAVADYQNLQKRMDRFRESLGQDILRSLTEQILPMADSLGRALEAARQTQGGDNIVRGLELMEKEFYDALERLGIRPVEAIGQRFDPHYHEAAMQEPVEGVTPNTVVRELKKGFVLGDQVIRPSQVVVAGTPGGGAQHGEAEEEPRADQSKPLS